MTRMIWIRNSMCKCAWDVYNLSFEHVPPNLSFEHVPPKLYFQLLPTGAETKVLLENEHSFGMGYYRTDWGFTKLLSMYQMDWGDVSSMWTSRHASCPTCRITWAFLLSGTLIHLTNVTAQLPSPQHSSPLHCWPTFKKIVYFSAQLRNHALALPYKPCTASQSWQSRAPSTTQCPLCLQQGLQYPTHCITFHTTD